MKDHEARNRFTEEERLFHFTIPNSASDVFLIRVVQRTRYTRESLEASWVKTEVVQYFELRFPSSKLENPMHLGKLAATTLRDALTEVLES